MKNFIIAILFVMSISLTSFGETFFEPQWNEFCPNQYINVDESKDYFMPEKKYWANRKMEFKNHMQTCRTVSEEQRDACFTNLRNLEMNATKTHMDELNVKYIKYNYWWN